MMYSHFGSREIPGRPGGVSAKDQLEFAVSIVLFYPDWGWAPEVETLIWGDGGDLIEDPLAKAFLDWAMTKVPLEERDPYAGATG